MLQKQSVSHELLKLLNELIKDDIFNKFVLMGEQHKHFSLSEGNLRI
jgi:hypothetical protein